MGIENGTLAEGNHGLKLAVLWWLSFDSSFSVRVTEPRFVPGDSQTQVTQMQSTSGSRSTGGPETRKQHRTWHWPCGSVFLLGTGTAGVLVQGFQTGSTHLQTNMDSKGESPKKEFFSYGLRGAMLLRFRPAPKCKVMFCLFPLVFSPHTGTCVLVHGSPN